MGGLGRRLGCMMDTNTQIGVCLGLGILLALGVDNYTGVFPEMGIWHKTLVTGVGLVVGLIGLQAYRRLLKKKEDE